MADKIQLHIIDGSNGQVHTFTTNPKLDVGVIIDIVLKEIIEDTNINANEELDYIEERLKEEGLTVIPYNDVWIHSI